MRKTDPVEIAVISIPVLIEVVVVMLAIGTAMMWVILYATRVPV